MKIKRIKFYQAIKCNSIIKSTKNEFGYIDSEGDGYDISLDAATSLISIVNKQTNEVTITGMNNVVYLNPMD